LVGIITGIEFRCPAAAAASCQLGRVEFLRGIIKPVLAELQYEYFVDPLSNARTGKRKVTVPCLVCLLLVILDKVHKNVDIFILCREGHNRRDGSKFVLVWGPCSSLTAGATLFGVGSPEDDP
jgi:hypothetical protein